MVEAKRQGFRQREHQETSKGKEDCVSSPSVPSPFSPTSFKTNQQKPPNKQTLLVERGLGC